jgi:8-oxo-dGTP pyrophosphatase MutT (NUDIX family)
MKIYIQETPLYLCRKAEDLGLDLLDKKILVSKYTGKIKHILNHIDLLEKNNKMHAVIIEYINLEVLIGDFLNLFKVLPAAGALVSNEFQEYLMIHRLGYWDLPKGKIEKGEAIMKAAIREIEEETGARKVIIEKYLLTTWHTYKVKKKRYLKETFWFSANAPKQELSAQSEENIEKAVWTRFDEIDVGEEPIYNNILDVIEASLD